MAAYAPEGVPSSDHLKLRTIKLPLDSDSIPDQHVVVEVLWISVDPFIRSKMTGNDGGLDFPQFGLGEVITELAIGRVVRSKDGKFSEGDLVLNAFSPVAEFYVVPAAVLRKIDPTAGVELPNYLSALGMPGFTAWLGIEVIGEAKPGSNVYISAAAGGVGMFAGQLAKLKGCRVVGSAGSDEKVKLLKEEFGYDEAFNYRKETDFDAALSKYCPNGIDIYFENVGGKMLEAVLNHVNKYARIPLCGMISDYNTPWTEREGVRNLLNMVGKEVMMKGFLVASYLNRFGDFVKEMEGYFKQGKINSKHKVYNGIECFQECFASLFTSSNIGKVVIQVKP
ncbi:NADPH:quinone reductase [Bertholletia excelsa]